MTSTLEHSGANAALKRELAREQSQRERNDDARVGQGSLEEGRSKDARETTDSGLLRRQRPF